MALTYGFYNSLNGDRKYNAIQMASIFDGIIRDGIFMTIGTNFMVKANSGMGIKVGAGRAWFDHTWTYNDSDMILNVQNSDNILDRIDAVILEVDTREEGRINSIKFLYGTPAPVPVKPTLIRESYLKQYALAYIYVAHGTTIINQSNITNMVGTVDTPFVTGPLQTIDATALLSQWASQGSIMFNNLQAQTNTQQNSWLTQMTNQQNVWQSEMTSRTTDIDAWYDSVKTDIAALQQFDFDNISNFSGVTKDTIFTSATVIDENIKKTVGNTLVATRKTTFNANGTISVLLRVYAEDGITITKQTTITTTFNANGSITEVVS